jgi:hypothetical protein
MGLVEALDVCARRAEKAPVARRVPTIESFVKWLVIFRSAIVPPQLRCKVNIG